MAGFAIGHLRIPGHRLLFILFLLGLTLPFEGIITPLYYLVRSSASSTRKLAIILPLIGLYMPFGVFWMRAHFVNMPTELSEAARVDGAGDVGPVLADPRAARQAGDRRRWRSCCRSGRGTSSCSPWCSWTTPRSARWPARSGAFQGQYATDIPLLCAGSLLILLPTLIVFLIFQRQFISALLQGSLKG